MKLKASTGRKLRYGGMSALLTILIVTAIILVNVIFSALSYTFTLYADVTPEEAFTMSEAALKVIREGSDIEILTEEDTDEVETTSPLEMVDRRREANRAYNEEHGLSEGDEGWKDENVKIKLIFCAEADRWDKQADMAMFYVYNMGRELETIFPDYIEVENYNIIRTPSLVSYYKINSLSTISEDSVIVDFDGEFRIRGLESFYIMTTEGANPEPWAYNGEKVFTAAILAVTRAEAPLALFTSNHEETMPKQLWTTLEDAGYDVGTIHLRNEEIPENCRLIIVFDPHSDFATKDGVSDVDEIAKLERHMDENNASLMVFFSPVTPVCPSFEEFLADWGIQYDRYTDYAGNVEPYILRDEGNSLSVDGHSIVGQYVTGTPADTFTADLRVRQNPKSVIFQEAMSISYAPSFKETRKTDEQDTTKYYDYATGSFDGTSRQVYRLFTAAEGAEAWAGDGVVERSTADNLLALATVSVENDYTQEDNVGQYSNNPTYVMAFGSTMFASDTLLQSNAYGNTDLLLSSFRIMGQEPVPVGIGFKPFADYTIDTITTAEATQYTVILTVIPALAALVTGVVVLVRRKNR